jgi:hypothetical protein
LKLRSGEKNGRETCSDGSRSSLESCVLPGIFSCAALLEYPWRSRPMKISFAIITLNEEANLPRCLQSIDPVADEIVIVDSGSRDGTRDIAAAHGAEWHEIPWQGYVRQKGKALQE